MTPKRLLFAAVAGAAILAAITVAIHSPRRAGAPWDFPVGAWVRYHDVDQIGGRTLECDEDWTLLQRDADVVTVEIKRSGASLPASRETLKIGLRGEPDSLDGATLRGRERVGELDCEAWEKSDEEAITRIWMNPHCAWPAKLVRSRTSGREVVERLWLGRHETLRVGGTDVSCECFHESRRAGDRTLEETDLWLNAAVPGHVVRRIRLMRDASGEARFHSEAAGFGSRKN